MIFCIGCKKPATKKCHVCCNLIYCKACRYWWADDHLRNCFTPMRSDLRDLIGCSQFASSVCGVIGKVSTTQNRGGDAKKTYVPTKSNMVLRSHKL